MREHEREVLRISSQRLAVARVQLQVSQEQPFLDKWVIDGGGGNEGKRQQREECFSALGRRYVLVRTIDSPAARERVGKTHRTLPLRARG